MPAPPRKPLANKAHKKEEEGAQHPEEEEGGGGGGDDALPQLYLYHRAATADSWDIISGKQDVLSSIFRFLQLPELAAMYVSSSSSSLPPSNHPPTHPPTLSPHRARASQVCLAVAKEEDLWKEAALRMWSRLVGAKEEDPSLVRTSTH